MSAAVDMGEVLDVYASEGQRVRLVRVGAEAHRIQDLELARLLGFERPRDVRKLIDRWAADLGEVSRHRGAKPSGSQGGRPEEGYLLSEEQALFITAKSETEKATEILKVIIAVFVAARRGGSQVIEHATPAAMPADYEAFEERILARFNEARQDLAARVAKLEQLVREPRACRSVAALGIELGLSRTYAFRLLHDRPELRQYKTAAGWDVQAVKAALKAQPEERRAGALAWKICRCRLSGLPARAALAFLIEEAWAPNFTTLAQLRDALGTGQAAAAALSQALSQLEGMGLLLVSRSPGEPVYLQLDPQEMLRLLDGQHGATCSARRMH